MSRFDTRALKDNRMAKRPHQIVRYKSAKPVMFLAHETPEASRRRFLKQELALEDDDFASPVSVLGGRDGTPKYMFRVTPDAGDRLKAMNLPADVLTMESPIPHHPANKGPRLP